MINTAFVAARKTPWEVIFPNLILLIVSLVAFAAIVYLVFLLASRVNVRVQEWLKYAVFLAPAVLLLLVGLVYPTLRTLVMSFMNADSTEFVGLDNYVWSFTIPEILIVLRNTAIWVLVVPILSTLLGLAIAYMTDRMKRPGIVKSLIFLPMAISFVGAGVIWKFVYSFQPNLDKPDIGLFSALSKAIGVNPPNWLLEAPMNTLLLILVMIWIQTGFCMVVISAAMKNVPDEVVEAAMLDGAGNWKRFLRVTIPMIRSTVIVVLTTTAIGTLKVFDIVRTMTGGLLCVLPIIAYNIRQLRRERTER
ncbi:MAG: sugar ABC transporter permease [Rhodoluna sp.]|nr:sugar ABC transporter permease [Rhodoluna sp.]